jgi:hypothetical protein
MTNTCGSTKIWPAYTSSLWSETEAKIHVFCIDCEPKSALSRRDWRGRIIGKGLHGFLNALCTRIKHNNKDEPLIRLLTICFDCCIALELDEVDQIDQIFGFRDNKRTPGEMVLRTLYKEVEVIVSSKAIITEGGLLNANTIKTIGLDGNWRKWYLED